MKEEEFHNLRKGLEVIHETQTLVTNAKHEEEEELRLEKEEASQNLVSLLNIERSLQKQNESLDVIAIVESSCVVAVFVDHQAPHAKEKDKLSQHYTGVSDKQSAHQVFAKIPVRVQGKKKHRKWPKSWKFKFRKRNQFRKMAQTNALQRFGIRNLSYTSSYSVTKIGLVIRTSPLRNSDPSDIHDQKVEKLKVLLKQFVHNLVEAEPQHKEQRKKCYKTWMFKYKQNTKWTFTLRTQHIQRRNSCVWCQWNMAQETVMDRELLGENCIAIGVVLEPQAAVEQMVLEENLRKLLSGEVIEYIQEIVLGANELWCKMRKLKRSKDWEFKFKFKSMFKSRDLVQARLWFTMSDSVAGCDPEHTIPTILESFSCLTAEGCAVYMDPIIFAEAVASKMVIMVHWLKKQQFQKTWDTKYKNKYTNEIEKMVDEFIKDVLLATRNASITSRMMRYSQLSDLWCRACIWRNSTSMLQLICEIMKHCHVFKTRTDMNIHHSLGETVKRLVEASTQMSYQDQYLFELQLHLTTKKKCDTKLEGGKLVFQNIVAHVLDYIVCHKGDILSMLINGNSVQLHVQQKQKQRQFYKSQRFKNKASRRRLLLLHLVVCYEFGKGSSSVWHRWRRKKWHTTI